MFQADKKSSGDLGRNSKKERKLTTSSPAYSMCGSTKHSSALPARSD